MSLYPPCRQAIVGEDVGPETAARERAANMWVGAVSLVGVASNRRRITHEFPFMG